MLMRLICDGVETFFDGHFTNVQFARSANTNQPSFLICPIYLLSFHLQPQINRSPSSTLRFNDLQL